MLARFTAILHVDKLRTRTIAKRLGELIPLKAAKTEFAKLRVAQVGPKSASATITCCEGRWMDGPAEPLLYCEVEYAPSPREESLAQFCENMLMLAEQLAERLGQKEIWLRLDNQLYRANAPNEPAPKPFRRSRNRGHVPDLGRFIAFRPMTKREAALAAHVRCPASNKRKR